MTHERSEFPQYYHVEDLHGNVFALVCMETPTKIVVIQKREQRKSFIVSTVSTHEDIKALAPGQMLGASPKDYSDVLHKEWGFSLSPDVLCDRLGTGETHHVERSVIADDTPPEDGPAPDGDTDVGSGDGDPEGAGTGDEAATPEPDDDGDGIAEPVQEPASEDTRTAEALKAAASSAAQ